jgi:hypothetical protein
MSRKRIVQIIAICLLLLAVAFLLYSTNWNETKSAIGFYSLVFGTLGSIISIFIPTVYTFNFTDTDWKKNEIENDYFLIIQAKKHGIGNSPQVQTFQKSNNAFEEVGVSSHHDKKGNVTIGANSTFKGKVIIT